MGNDLPFGGVAVFLTGDPGQIPAVKSRCLWDTSPGGTEDEDNALSLYRSQFKHCIVLERVERIDAEDPEAEAFLAIQDNLRNGQNTIEQWEKVCRTCLKDTMGLQKWEEEFGGDQDITHLFTTNKEVLLHNHNRLRALDKPIALIQAQHSTAKAKSMTPDRLRGLTTSLYLSVGSKVYLTSNLGTGVGLCNGTVGYVKDIVYQEQVQPQSSVEEEQAAPEPTVAIKPPCLPKYVWVDFGASYRGESFFPNDDSRRGWVPVHPMTASEYVMERETGEVTDHSRTMIPLRLAWAWTIWKAQGQTYTGKVIANLSDREKEHGLTYVVFSRVKKLRNLGIIGGLSLERFTTRIQQQKKMRPRREEERRMQELAVETVRILNQLREDGTIAVRYREFN
jgi:hypothetical protein